MSKAWYYSGGLFAKLASFYVTLLLPLWFPADISANTASLWSLSLLWSGILMSGQLEVQNKSMHKSVCLNFQTVYILLPLFLFVGLLSFLVFKINAFAILVGLGLGLGMSKGKIELFLENYRRSFFQVIKSYSLIIIFPLQLLWFGVDVSMVFQVAGFCGIIYITRSIVALFFANGLSLREFRTFFPKILPYHIQSLFSWLSGLGIGYILSLFLLDEAVVKYYVLFSLANVFYFLPNLVVTVWGSTILRGQVDSLWKWIGLSVYFLSGYACFKYQGLWVISKLFSGYSWSSEDLSISESIMLGYFLTVPMWRARFKLAFKERHTQLNRNATLGLIIGVTFLYLGLVGFQWQGLGLSILMMYSIQSLSVSILSSVERYFFIGSAALVLVLVL